MAGLYEGTDAALSAGTDDSGLQHLYALSPRGAAAIVEKATLEVVKSPGALAGDPGLEK